MPIIRVEGPLLTKEQKKEVIQKFTQTASEIMNIPKQAFIVVIDEKTGDNIGVGGEMLSEMHK